MKRKILLSLLVAICLITITGCGSEKEEKQVILNDNLSFEVNEELKLYSLISDDNEVEILSEDSSIDTSVLGEKEIVIKYKDNDEEREQIVKITIIDTKVPTIEFKKELSTTEGTKIDLLKGVKVSDNSNEEITATVEGEYDINKVGTYNLKYVAVDSSGNKAEEEFVLKVNKKVIKSVKVGNVTLYFGKYKMKGDIPSGYNGTITIKADGTATSTGYYYNSKGQFVKKNLTGTWSFKENSILGVAGDSSELSKVNGIYFTWKTTGEKLGYGLGDKSFGDQFHGYYWYSE